MAGNSRTNTIVLFLLLIAIVVGLSSVSNRL